MSNDVTPADVNKMPVVKLKALAKKLGVNPKQALTKLRAAVKAALKEQGSSESSGGKSKGKAKNPKRSTKTKAVEEESEESGPDLSGILSRLDALEAAVAELQEAITGEGEEDEEESADEDVDEEEVEFDDEDDSEEEEDDDEEDDEEVDEDDIPDTIKPYLEDDGDGGYRLILDPADIDEMDTDTLKDVLTVLGIDFGKTRSARKLQAMLREELEKTAAEVDDSEDDEDTVSGDDVELEPGTRVAFTDDDGDVYAAVIADPDEYGEADDEDEVRIVEFLDDDSDEEPWVMDVSPSSLDVLED